VKSLLHRRPSPALVIASIALFVSLSGVSYGVATGFIDSREIKNNEVRSVDLRNNDIRTRDLRNNEVRGLDIRNSTVQGRDVALNTLTGTDIREDTLEKVPSAAAADTATTATTAGSAGSAASVGGMTVKKFFVKQPAGTAASEIFRGEGFVLEGACTGGDAVLNLRGIAGGPETNAAFEGSGGGAPSGSDSDLEPADSLVLANGAIAAATGTAVVSTTAGAVSTIVYAAQDAPAFQGENVCALSGTVTSG
jgi:hypothetical protein